LTSGFGISIFIWAWGLEMITEKDLSIIEDKEFQERNCSDCHFADPDRLRKERWCTYPGELEIKNGYCLEKRPRQHCFACAICIGPFYLETYPCAVGDKVLCGHCFNQLEKRGYLPLDAYINIDMVGKLMPDGSVEKPPRKAAPVCLDETKERKGGKDD